jgi:hypothetical protein
VYVLLCDTSDRLPDVRLRGDAGPISLTPLVVFGKAANSQNFVVHAHSDFDALYASVNQCHGIGDRHCLLFLGAESDGVEKSRIGRLKVGRYDIVTPMWYSQLFSTLI